MVTASNRLRGSARGRQARIAGATAIAMCNSAAASLLCGVPPVLEVLGGLAIGWRTPPSPGSEIGYRLEL